MAVYLQMEPMIGNSKNPRYKKAIEVNSYSFPSLNTGGDGGALLPRRKWGDLEIIVLGDIYRQFTETLPQQHKSNAVDSSFDGQLNPVFNEALLFETQSKDNKTVKSSIAKMSTVIVTNVNPGRTITGDDVTSVRLKFKEIQFVIP